MQLIDLLLIIEIYYYLKGLKVEIYKLVKSNKLNFIDIAILKNTYLQQDHIISLSPGNNKEFSKSNEESIAFIASNIRSRYIIKIDIPIEIYPIDEVVIMQINEKNIIKVIKLILMNIICVNPNTYPEIHHINTLQISTVIFVLKLDTQQENTLLSKTQLNIITKTNIKLLVPHLSKYYIC